MSRYYSLGMVRSQMGRDVGCRWNLERVRWTWRGNKVRQKQIAIVCTRAYSKTLRGIYHLLITFIPLGPFLTNPLALPLPILPPFSSPLLHPFSSLLFLFIVTKSNSSQLLDSHIRVRCLTQPLFTSFLLLSLTSSSISIPPSPLGTRIKWIND